MLSHITRAASAKDRMPPWCKLIINRANICYSDIGYGEVEWTTPLPFSAEDLKDPNVGKRHLQQPPQLTVSKAASSTPTPAPPPDFADVDLRPCKRFSKPASSAVSKPASIPSSAASTTAAEPLADVGSADHAAVSSTQDTQDGLDSKPITPVRNADVGMFRDFPTPPASPEPVPAASACIDSNGKIDLQEVLKRASNEDREYEQHKQPRLNLASIGTMFECNSDSEVDMSNCSPASPPLPVPKSEAPTPPCSPNSRPAINPSVRATGFVTKRGAFLELYDGYRAFTNNLVQHPVLPSAVQGHFTNVPGLGDVVETIQGLHSADLPAAVASIRPKYSKNSSNGVTREHHFDGSITVMFYHHRACMYFDHRTMFCAMKCGEGLGISPPTKLGGARGGGSPRLCLNHFDMLTSALGRILQKRFIHFFFVWSAGFMIVHHGSFEGQPVFVADKKDRISSVCPSGVLLYLSLGGRQILQAPTEAYPNVQRDLVRCPYNKLVDFSGKAGRTDYRGAWGGEGPP